MAHGARAAWLAPLLYGLLTTLCQVLALREIHASLRGSELAYGAALAQWLLASALGAALSRPHAASAARERGWLVVLALSAPLTTLWARAARPLLFSALLAGETPGTTQSLLLPCLVTLPAGLVAGAAYGSLLGRATGRSAAAYYAAVALGDLAGGVVASLRPVAESLTPVVALLACAGALALLSSRTAVLTRGALLAGAGALAWLALSPWVGAWELASSQRSLGPGMRAVASFATVRGGLAVSDRDGTRSFHLNGALIATLPDEASEAIHYPLLTGLPPGARVALLEGALSGATAEVLEHRPSEVVVTTDEARLLEIARAVLPAGALDDLDDPRVRLVTRDARQWLRREHVAYDAIAVLGPPPDSLAANRLYTTEFLREARRRLSPDGLLFLSVPGNGASPDTEEAALAGCILAAMREVFPQTAALAGRPITLVARNGATPLRLDRGEAAEALAALGADNRIVVPETVRWADPLDPRRREALERRLGEWRGPTNRDLRPVATLYAAAHASRASERGGLAEAYRRALLGLAAAPTLALGGATALLCGLLGVAARIARRRSGRPPIAALLASIAGCALVCEVGLIGQYESAYGAVYEHIGLLLALVMGGVAFGAVAAARARRGRADLRLAAVAVALLAAGTPWAVAGGFGLGEAAGLVTAWLCALLLGVGLGAAYPLALARAEGDAASAPRRLYAADLLGASLGALLGGALLLPALGPPAAGAAAAALVLALALGAGR